MFYIQSRRIQPIALSSRGLNFMVRFNKKKNCRILLILYICMNFFFHLHRFRTFQEIMQSCLPTLKIKYSQFNLQSLVRVFFLFLKIMAFPVTVEKKQPTGSQYTFPLHVRNAHNKNPDIHALPQAKSIVHQYLRLF